ncbi:unnamed protein product [Rangifer tarandus platyrhynchus]|uniref:Uncharacterized protein n=2 Tax=Rangifer tarandus platyrhynchus TaxID=3082113 RepID=A0ACB0E331_RANTA|nr:unnamed protein product [Rangifer tarandus platyrhynchus]CAI9694912.1 unnamed protein product [Rangifer tarandus platyrhynchus]
MQRRLPALPGAPAGHAVPSASADDLYRQRSRSGLSRSRSLGNGRACPGAPGPSHLPILARHLGSRRLRSTLDAQGRAHSSAHPEPGKLGISPGFWSLQLRTLGGRGGGVPETSASSAILAEVPAQPGSSKARVGLLIPLTPQEPCRHLLCLASFCSLSAFSSFHLSSHTQPNGIPETSKQNPRTF